MERAQIDSLREEMSTFKEKAFAVPARRVARATSSLNLSDCSPSGSASSPVLPLRGEVEFSTDDDDIEAPTKRAKLTRAGATPRERGPDTCLQALIKNQIKLTLKDMYNLFSFPLQQET